MLKGAANDHPIRKRLRYVDWKLRSLRFTEIIGSPIKQDFDPELGFSNDSIR
jgi:hypothetical protein